MWKINSSIVVFKYLGKKEKKISHKNFKIIEK